MWLLFKGGAYFLGKPTGMDKVCGNESYNTNNPTASPLTVVRNYLNMCAEYTSHGYYSTTAFILVRAAPIVQLLFKGGVYSKKYAI